MQKYGLKKAPSNVLSSDQEFDPLVILHGNLRRFAFP